jgi:hypothetical protein
MQNLWSEFDDEQPLSESAGRAQKHTISQRRRPTEQAVLSILREWLLHDFIAPYCRSLAATRIFRRCYWIDGLGGKHMLQLTLSISQALANESKPIALHSIILEAKNSRRKESNADKSITLPQEGGVVHANWPEAASTLLQALDQSAAIFLLNPFGSSTPFTIEDLTPLYQRTAPTELFLFISHKQVETFLLPNLDTSAGASAFTALLHSDRWKSLLADSTEIEQTIDGLINAFLFSMQKQHFHTVQRIPLLMHTSPTIVEPVPYTLIFATRRLDSLVHMNDAICAYRRRLQEQSLEGVLTEEWFAAQQRERFAGEIQHLRQRILHQGRTQRQRRWPDLRQQVLVANFGQFTLHEYDQVIQNLLQSGEVRCEWRQKPAGNPDHEDSRIPRNEDTLLWK